MKYRCIECQKHLESVVWNSGRSRILEFADYQNINEIWQIEDKMLEKYIDMIGLFECPECGSEKEELSELIERQK